MRHQPSIDAVEVFNADFDKGFATLVVAGSGADPVMATVKLLIMESIIGGDDDLAYYTTRCLVRYLTMAEVGPILLSMPTTGTVN